MELKELTADEIGRLAAGIATSATTLFRQFAADKQEAALLAEVRASRKPKKEQVLQYLQRTARTSIKNSYLSDYLFINTARLKRIRQELEDERTIVVYMVDGVIHLRARDTVRTLRSVRRVN